MPSGPRIRTNNVFGTVSDNPLTNAATTLNSNGLADLAAVSSAHAVLVLDPLRTAGAPEIVIVTAHTGSATSATITRGAYGTSARQHAQGTLWVHAPTIDDVIRIVTSSTRPSDPYEGQHIYETDTNRDAVYDGAAWLPGGIIVACTSSTRPAGPYEGQRIYETDTDKDYVYDGSGWVEMGRPGGWTDFTPTLTQNNVAVTKTVTYARWTRAGRLITVGGRLAVTGTGTASQAVRVGIPVNILQTNDTVVGQGWIFDSSASAVHRAFMIRAAAAELFFSPANSTVADVLGVTGFTAALASGDVVVYSASYEAAS